MALLATVYGVVWYFLLNCNIRESEASSYDCWDQTILVQPNDVTVKEGKEANFSCIVACSDRNNCITWELVPDWYDHRIEEDFDQGKRELTSTISILTIDKFFEYVRCSLKNIADFDQSNEVCYLSRKARATVYYFPKPNQISCEPTQLLPFNEGDMLRVKCTVPRCNPPVDLRWRFDSFEEPPSTFYRDVGRARAIEEEIEVTRGLHQKVLVCSASSIFAFPGEQTECDIGPINVYHQPIVRMSPSEVQICPSNTATNIFECHADGFPLSFTYSWECSPGDVVTGCNGSAMTAEISLLENLGNQSLEIGQILVICTVSNSEGTSNNVSRITLVESPDYIGSQGAIPGNDEETISLQLHRIYQVGLKTWNMELSCIVEPKCINTNISSVIILWYSNGDLITGGTRQYIANKSYVNSSLLLGSVSISDHNREIRCQTNTSQCSVETKTLTVNMSKLDLNQITLISEDNQPERAVSSLTSTDGQTLSWELDVTILRSRNVMWIILAGTTVAIFVISSVIIYFVRRVLPKEV